MHALTLTQYCVVEPNPVVRSSFTVDLNLDAKPTVSLSFFRRLRSSSRGRQARSSSQRASSTATVPVMKTPVTIGSNPFKQAQKLGGFLVSTADGTSIFSEKVAAEAERGPLTIKNALWVRSCDFPPKRQLRNGIF